MKLTTQKLKKLIREELKKIVEMDGRPSMDGKERQRRNVLSRIRKDYYILKTAHKNNIDSETFFYGRGIDYDDMLEELFQNTIYYFETYGDEEQLVRDAYDFAEEQLYPDREPNKWKPIK